MVTWCLSLILSVLSRMWPWPAEKAAVGLWEEARAASPATRGLAHMGGKRKGQGVWVRHC